MASSQIPVFFARPEELRAWFRKNHARANELWIGFYRKGSGKPSMTWPESVDEALCFGWIDGIRQKVDDTSYKIRFTPRRARSKWSRVNIARVTALSRAGRMKPPGVAAFAKCQASKSGRYSFENRDSAKLSDSDERTFRHDAQAWEFFQAQPPGYRRLASWYVISAKRPETRRKRLERLINASHHKRRIN